MELTIVRHEPKEGYFLCHEKDGTLHRVDLVVAGGPASKALEADPKRYEGRKIRVEWLQAYLELAEGVVLLDEDKP